MSYLYGLSSDFTRGSLEEGGEEVGVGESESESRARYCVDDVRRVIWGGVEGSGGQVQSERMLDRISRLADWAGVSIRGGRVVGGSSSEESFPNDNEWAMVGEGGLREVVERGRRVEVWEISRG